MEDSNRIVISDKYGTGIIKIDGIELKGVSKYEIKRDTDLVNLTFNMTVPKQNFETN